MKKISVALALLMFVGFVQARDAAFEAEQLIKEAGTKASMEYMTGLMLSQQIRQNPGLKPFEAVIREFLEKHVSYESVKGELVQLYVDAFTLDELIELRKFYGTDVGKKSVLVMPDLMQKGSEIGARRVRENLAELQASIAQEKERLETEAASRSNESGGD